MGEKETADRSVGAGQATEIIERRAAPPSPEGGTGPAAMTSNLNLSKSNINRESAAAAGSEDDPSRTP